ncbi:replication factor A2 [Pseudovirgaria hyperparasitica]|uniref:Replication factor A2 n=1 Tax=Pseudovirgaria hyperparasitica TaxID=470096 RepID=A0A6A6WHF3_9PEZI|nr:replication factor A2 [Pseudovirgaria hyperparasitica]KAF2761514.1 replication factor A2 [Pseudovirgaria hyperparasitica]
MERKEEQAVVASSLEIQVRAQVLEEVYDRSKDTLRPVTIKQINEAPPSAQEGDFKIDDTEISQLTFVGQIRNISTQATNVTYKLDDGTGTIEVKQWVDADATTPFGEADNSGKKKLAENKYARVYGKLKSFNNKRHVGATIIRPVTDYNEVSYHLLEATAVHLHYTRGPLNGGQKSTGTNGTYDAQAGTNMNMASGGQSMAGLSANAKKVFMCLSTSQQSNEGLHVQVIASETRMDPADVYKGGEDLLAAGMIYTTVDDSTWALLEI